MEGILLLIVMGIYYWIKDILDEPKRQQKLLQMKPLVDRERQLREDLFSGKIFKNKK